MRSAALTVVLFLLAAPAVRAEPLGDLRAALAKFPGGDAVDASIQIKQTRRLADAKKPSEVQVQLNVHAGAQGLQFTFPPELMRDVDREAQAHTANAELPMPIAGVLATVTPVRITNVLNAGPDLLRDLDGASVLESRADTLEGKAAHLLVLDLPGHMSAKDKADLKQFQDRLKLWLDADGRPMASEERVEFSGRRFLIGFGGSQTYTARYVVSGNRLLATSRTWGSSFKGFGEDNESTTSATLSLH